VAFDHPAAPAASLERPRVRREERMRETLQCEYPDDLAALLDKRQQLTAVLSVPPLARP